MDDAVDVWALMGSLLDLPADQREAAIHAIDAFMARNVPVPSPTECADCRKRIEG